MILSCSLLEGGDGGNPPGCFEASLPGPCDLSRFRFPLLETNWNMLTGDCDEQLARANCLAQANNQSDEDL